MNNENYLTAHRINIQFLFVFVLGFGLPAKAGPLVIESESVGPTEKQVTSFASELMTHPSLAPVLNGGRYHVIESRLHRDDTKANDGNPTPGASHGSTGETNEDAQIHPAQPALPDRFDLRLFDYGLGRLWSLRGNPGAPFESALTPLRDQPEATWNEFTEAVRVLKMDKSFASALGSGRLRPYPAMPPIIESRPRGDGTCARMVPIGLEPVASGSSLEGNEQNSTHQYSSRHERHEIVGVDLTTAEVHRFPSGAPPLAIAAPIACGPPSADQATTRRGTSGTAQITVRRDGQTLWRMRVTRPSDSSGAKGSGMELRDVRYKGRLVLDRAHIPILNVNYERNACGPFRDWAYSENAFEARGRSLAPGIIETSSPPRTIMETNRDAGNFRGVAIHEHRGELVLLSEISAGWYRYVSEFRFRDDGTIKPVIKFSAVRNSCTCKTHNHHVYWRFDFDINEREGNSLQVLKDGAWSTVSSESKFWRARGGPKAWRVIHTASGTAYQIDSGPRDGYSDEYGDGDVWALKYMKNQLDDSRARRSTRAGLDAFLTNQSLRETDIVLWYAAHLNHVEVGPHGVGIVGPTIRPVQLNSN